MSPAYTGTGLGRRSSIKAKIFWNKIFDTAFPAPRSSLIAEAGVIAPHMAGWTANGTRQKMGNTFLMNFIGFGTDDVFVILTFQKFTKVGRGKSGIPLEIVAQVPFPVTLDDRFQNVAPAVGAMNIAGAQRTPTDGTVGPCGAIRSSRYRCLEKYSRQPR